MKTLIISDIHSNIHALEAIWAKEKDSDQVYCAGDLVDYGPYPQEVIAWLRAHQIPSVQGNHDRFLAKIYRQGQTLAQVDPQERAWVHYNAGLLHETEIAYLENLPLSLCFEADQHTYGLTHLYQDYEEIVSLHAFELFRQQIYAQDNGAAPARLIFGHTHRQSVRYLSDAQLWLNPGSVSYRRRDDPDQTAHYALIIDGRIALRRLAYDVRPVFQAMQPVQLKDGEMHHARRCFGG